MGRINICGKPKCCPVVTTNEAGNEVKLEEGGRTITLTFEQVGMIYRDMCIKKQIKCDKNCCKEKCCND